MTSTAPAQARGMPAVRAVIADAFAVIGHAGRLLLRHWPVLLAVLFAGEAGRYAALWAAVVLSDWSGTLGVLVLALAPMAAVSALIGALYVLRHSLPSLGLSDVAGSDGDSASGSRGVLGVLGSVMIPFLAIYASYGFLDEDVFRFVNTAVADELFDVDVFLGTEQYDPHRTALAAGWVAVVVAAVAVALRFGLGALAQRRRVPGLAWVAAYVEVLWLVTLARVLTTHQDAAVGWVQGRAVVEDVIGVWESVTGLLGPVGAALDSVLAWVLDLVASADALVVVPIAWLTVGAVVYGQQISGPTRRSPSHRRARARHHQVAGDWGREVGDDLTGGLGSRFGALTTGVRQLAMAGLAPMVLFALAFVIAQRLEDVVNLGWRLLLGPMPLNTYLAFAPQLEMVAHVIGTVAVVCLLGAAIDRMLGGARAESAVGAEVTAPR